jgi:hypothetical protein
MSNDIDRDDNDLTPWERQEKEQQIEPVLSVVQEHQAALSSRLADIFHEMHQQYHERLMVKLGELEGQLLANTVAYVDAVIGRVLQAIADLTARVEALEAQRRKD